MKIYWIKAQAPHRVLAVARYLDLKAEYVNVVELPGRFEDADFLKLNPNGKAPVLVDGTTVLWESNAIMAHLAIKAGSDLWPAKNPAEQVEVLRWLSWGGCHWDEVTAPFYFEHVVKETFGMGEPDRASLPAKIPALKKFAEILDGHLAKRSYVACDRLTIADFALVSMACHWRESEMPLAAYPHVTTWLDRISAMDAWKNAFPKG